MKKIIRNFIKEQIKHLAEKNNNDEPSDAEYDQMAKDAEQDDLLRKAAELGYIDLEEIGNFHDPRMSSGNFDHLTAPNPKDQIFKKKYKGNGIYDIFKNGKKVKTIKGEGEANAWINNAKKSLEEIGPYKGGNLLPGAEDIDFDVKSIDMVYTDFGRFYGFYMYSEPGLKGQREKFSFRADVDDFLKSKGIKTEIPIGYDEDVLDSIVADFKKQGIEAEYGDHMDVSEGDPGLEPVSPDDEIYGDDDKDNFPDFKEAYTSEWDPETAAANQEFIRKRKKDKDDYGRSVSGKDKRTFVDPKDLTPAARAKKLAGMKEEKSKEDQLKIARAAFEKAEMNGDIRGQELALAAIDLIKGKRIKGLNKPSRLKESKLLDRIKEKPTVEERTAVLKYWLAKRTSNFSSKSGTRFPDPFSLNKENYEGNDPLILSYIEKMDQDIPFRILRQEMIFFKGELIRMNNHPDDQPYIQDWENTLEINRTDPFGNKLTPQNHDFIADFVKANPDLAESKTLKEMASELGYLNEITVSGGQEAARNYPPTEDPGDMFAQKEVEELLPASFASRNQELKARIQGHANWAKQDRFNNTFVHFQSNTVTDGNNTYRIAMSQHYNGNYTGFKNPRFTEIRVKELDDEMEKDLGKYVVDTTALMQDLRKLKTIERVS